MSRTTPPTWRERAGSVLLYGAGLVFALPVYWMLVLSMSRPDQAASTAPPLVPTVPWRNFDAVFSAQDWPRYFANTILVAVSIAVLATLTSCLAAYALANVRLPGKRILFGLVIAAFVVPTELGFVPNFVLMRATGLLNTYWSLILPFAASPLGIFILRQRFLALPRELWEVAQTEGCSHLRYLFTIVLPSSRSAVAVTALISFIAGWNLFEWPLIFTTDETVRPVQVALSYFNNVDAGSSPTILAAAGVLVTVPVLAIYLLARRQLTAAMTGESPIGGTGER
ncbi:carbohydrate ABC transporter permease [Dactylosporangium cerinum]|uniref:Carbohydrate ABC transporter permease n=1 Tax=Dactylosporangium cerinum TaxID=1434730 RepID=A0ABV9VSC9_9ACTN